MRVFLILYPVCLALTHVLAQTPFAVVKTNIDRGNYSAAERVLDSCATKEFYPDSVLYYEMHCVLRQEKIKDARRKLKELEKDYPNFSEIRYMKGLLKFTVEDYAGSVDEFSTVLTTQPGNVKALYNRALAYGMLEDFGRATEDLNACIAKDPSFADAYYSRAHWKEYLGLYAEAAEDYEQTIKYQPGNFDAYIALAFIHHLQKDELGACEIIKKAISAGSQAAEEAQYLYCK